MTLQANEWAMELSGLSKEQIKVGIANLETRFNNSFPPNAMEFKILCKSGSIEGAIDEIFEFIERGQDSSFWWQTSLAYTIFKKLEYRQGDNETRSTLERRIKQINKGLKDKDLIAVPKKPAGNLEQKWVKPTKQQFKRGRANMRTAMAGNYDKNAVLAEIWPTEVRA